MTSELTNSMDIEAHERSCVTNFVARHHPRLQSPNNAYMGARLGKTASTTGFLFSEKRAITYLTGLLEKGTFWT